MSPKVGRPVKDDSAKKSVRLEIRMTVEESEMLSQLSEVLQISKTDTIIKALYLLAEQQK